MKPVKRGISTLHKNLYVRLFSIALLLGIASAPAEQVRASIATQHLSSAPDPHLLEEALNAISCAQSAGYGAQAQNLTLIDYRIPSTQKRLWVINIATGQVIYHEHVAHGRNSGENYARHFSNTEGSNQSSLGLYLTQETYVGGNGYSLRLNGLEPGINDMARKRAIVMHGAPYVNPDMAARQGRLGRSLGCPALRGVVAGPIINTIKQGNFLYAYYPDSAWLRQSRFAQCKAKARLQSAQR